jgi:hypothetical protein
LSEQEGNATSARPRFHEAGAPADTEITPEMIEAGVSALEDELVDGYSVRVFRPDLVCRIYSVMRSKDQRPTRGGNLVRQNAQVVDHCG